MIFDSPSSRSLVETPRSTLPPQARTAKILNLINIDLLHSCRSKGPTPSLTEAASLVQPQRNLLSAESHLPRIPGFVDSKPRKSLEGAIPNSTKSKSFRPIPPIIIERCTGALDRNPLFHPGSNNLAANTTKNPSSLPLIQEGIAPVGTCGDKITSGSGNLSGTGNVSASADGKETAGESKGNGERQDGFKKSNKPDKKGKEREGTREFCGELEYEWESKRESTCFRRMLRGKPDS